MPVTNAQDMAKAGSLINSDGTTVSVAADLLIADKLVHTGDTNTAIRFPASDTVTVETSGTERMRIDSSGNVGIGTNSPSTPSGKCLTIYDSNIPRLNLKNSTSGDTSTDGVELYINGSDAYLNNRENGSVAIGTNNATRLLIDSSGNVGIGVSSLSDKFTVSGTTGVAATIDMSSGISTGTEYGSLKFTASSPNFTGAEIRGIHTNGGTNLGVLAFHTSATERLRIDSSGNVGIGTTSPIRKFSISGGGIAFQDSGGAARSIAFIDSNTNISSVSIIGDASTGNLLFNTNSFGSAATERLRIDSSGKVLIGTTSNDTGGRLEVKQASGETGIGIQSSGTDDSKLYFRTASGSYGGDITFNGSYVKISAGTTERLRITSGGLVCIGTTTGIGRLSLEDTGGSLTSTPLTINSTSGAGDRYSANFYYSGGRVGSITVNASATAFNTSSDYRLKTNIEPISNGIDRVKQLPVYRFNWITNQNGNKVDGFVAHEVTPVVPEAISGEKDAVDADGKPVYQGIDQSKIVPLLTAALKEAIAKIETLESKVAALEAA